MTVVNHSTETGTPRQAAIDAALLVLGQMGLSPADLVATPQNQPVLPTFAEYVPVVSEAVSAGTRRARRRFRQSRQPRHRQGSSLEARGQA